MYISKFLCNKCNETKTNASPMKLNVVIKHQFIFGLTSSWFSAYSLASLELILLEQKFLLSFFIT